MSERAEGETNEQLIATAAAHDYSVSKRQLAEWHRAGLLPEPQQVFGERTGSISWYPAGTGERLLALCALRKKWRRNANVAWGLWWAGYDVPETYVREPLERAAVTWREGVDQIRQLLKQDDSGDRDRAAEGELSEAFLDFLDRTATVRGLRKVMVQARKRVGRGKFPTLVRVFALVVTGTFEGYSVDPVTGTTDEEREIVEKGLGLTRARTDRLVDAGPWLTGDTEQQFVLLSRLFRQYPPGYDLEETSVAELEKARDEIKLFINLFAGFGGIAEQIFGRGAFGFTAFGTIAGDQRPLDQAMLVLLWRMLRMSDLGAAMDAFLPIAQQWQQTVQPTIAATQQLRTEVPAAAALMDPKRIGSGLRSKHGAKRRAEALRTLRAEHADELDAFLAQHPELKTLELREPTEPGESKEAHEHGEVTPLETPLQGDSGARTRPPKRRRVRREEP